MAMMITARQPFNAFRVFAARACAESHFGRKDAVIQLSQSEWCADGSHKASLAASLHLQGIRSIHDTTSSTLLSSANGDHFTLSSTGFIFEQSRFGGYQQTRRLHFLRLMSGRSSSKPKPPGPDAGDCDEALGDYQALKQRLELIQKPSTLRPWTQVGYDMGKTLINATIAILKFTISIPVRIKDFYAMPKAEWVEWKSGAWKTVKHEAHHYWVGTKLLWMEIKISSRLAIKAMRGPELTRRERRQLTRTVADMFRLVPMILILAVPFMELALPVLLKIFPNLLPSTYEDKLKKEEELKRMLSVKLELARFLQDTVAVVAKDVSRRKGSGSAASELYQFMTKVRSGQPVENSDILKFAQLFNDELTLDNWERVQLVSICQFVGLSPFGTDSYLRNRLRSHLKETKKDDYEIEKEGLENLTDEELRAACRARGIRASFGEGSTNIMQRRLQDWLDLSLHRGLPSSLLLLSRAFTITSDVHDVAQKKDMAYEKVKETLSKMPEDLVDKVGFDELGGEPEALEKKLLLLKREEALIKEELKRNAASKQKKAEAAAVAETEANKVKEKEALKATESDSHLASSEEELAMAAEQQQKRLRHTVQALIDLATGSGVAKERVIFMELLKKDTDRINEDLKHSSGSSIFLSNVGMHGKGKEEARDDEDAAAGSDGKASKRREEEDRDDKDDEDATKRLGNRVSRMLMDIEKELDKVERSIGNRMHLLDTDKDGIISQQELEAAFQLIKAQLSHEEFQQLYQQLKEMSADSSGNIQVAHLLELAVTEQQHMEESEEARSEEVVKIHMK